MNIKDFKIEFDEIFIPELNKLIASSIDKIDGHPIKEYLGYIIQIASNGKRIRPYNAALSYMTYSNNDWKDISNVLVGIEFIHLMALIQDDVMDNSNTRHGVVSMHQFVSQNLDEKSNLGIEQNKHLSQSQAILVGDLMFAWAYNYFSRQNLDSNSWAMVNELMEEVILGQMMDVNNPAEEKTTTDLIEQKMLLKTARYTFTRPFLLGAVYAGKKVEELDWLYQFGDSLGLLFQMQDDILDIKGKSETINKEPLEDIRNGIHTLISNYIINTNDQNTIDTWNTWFGNKSINNQEEICILIEKAGGFDFAFKYTEDKKSLSKSALDQSGIDSNQKEPFDALLQIISKRKF